MEAGAHQVINPLKEDVVKIVRDATGGLGAPLQVLITF
jgi:hypothetical protein